MKNALLLSILSIFSLTNLAANDDDSRKAYPGYVVTVQGDTLNGIIEMMSPTLNEIKVKLIDEEGQVAIYRSKEVESYAFKIQESTQTATVDRWINYKKRKVNRSPIPFSSREVLVECQIEGALSLYNFYLETRAAAHRFDHTYYIEKDGKMFEVTRYNYKEVLSALFEEVPELKAKIGKRGYGYSKLDVLILEYNRSKLSA